MILLTSTLISFFQWLLRNHTIYICHGQVLKYLKYFNHQCWSQVVKPTTCCYVVISVNDILETVTKSSIPAFKMGKWFGRKFHILTWLDMFELAGDTQSHWDSASTCLQFQVLINFVFWLLHQQLPSNGAISIDFSLVSQHKYTWTWILSNLVHIYKLYF